MENVLKRWQKELGERVGSVAEKWQSVARKLEGIAGNKSVAGNRERVA